MAGYPLNQSPLYKLTSPRRLAEVLKIGLPDLEALIDHEVDNYKIFYISQGDGKKRKVEQPKDRTQGLHKRVANLLGRIEPPEYLHSAVKRRSYVTNALQHVGRHSMVKVDVKTFFPSAKRAAVFRFFYEDMECARDVAGMLARLLTVHGHLPTGGSASPILSFYAYKDMFDELEALAASRGVRMTVYVDDMTFSGEYASRRFLSEVRQVIQRYGLRTHKAKHFGPSKTKIVTGVGVRCTKLALPNRRNRRIADDFVALSNAPTPKAKLALLNRMISRLHEAAQFDPRWRKKAATLQAERLTLKAKVL